MLLTDFCPRHCVFCKYLFLVLVAEKGNDYVLLMQKNGSCNRLTYIVEKIKTLYVATT